MSADLAISRQRQAPPRRYFLVPLQGPSLFVNRLCASRSKREPMPGAAQAARCFKGSSTVKVTLEESRRCALMGMENRSLWLVNHPPKLIQNAIVKTGRKMSHRLPGGVGRARVDAHLEISLARLCIDSLTPAHFQPSLPVQVWTVQCNSLHSIMH